ncbi:alpha/beta hydrolase [Micromonospora cathayae]|uniref:Alpha/beta hydrolase n=1 Tax=Micromonospora cathayae TaxID=3028804 RepID=A0ABY7ZKN1_9ACTN|nr:alpha/beta hydrolase [Micromonospora sp. HUAS 3]WDZ83006.1 alpha/beta hydrolase [Micromonospora sp. HUAS 3]
MELSIDAGDVRLPGTLTLPAGPPRAGVVLLHGAGYGHRSYFLYEHLARVLPPLGIAVLRYDRRPVAAGDVPLAVQAADAAAAVARLRAEIGDRPVGLWGWSQGAWAALAAATSTVPEAAFLVLLSASGVTPARQMRYGTAEQLRRHGYGPEPLADLLALRTTVEEYLRGRLPRDRAQAEVDRYADQPWFPLAYVRRHLPEPGAWTDMDHDPAPTMAAVTCPVLLYYGETDEWVPVEESLAAWRDTGTAATVCRLAGCDHAATPLGGTTIAEISPTYSATLRDWLTDRLARSR